jgi:hypothetical protein
MPLFYWIRGTWDKLLSHIFLHKQILIILSIEGGQKLKTNKLLIELAKSLKLIFVKLCNCFNFGL